MPQVSQKPFTLPQYAFDYLVLQDGGLTKLLDRSLNVLDSQTASTGVAGGFDDAVIINDAIAIMTSGQKLVLYGNLFIMSAITTIINNIVIEQTGGTLQIGDNNATVVNFTAFTFGNVNNSPIVVFTATGIKVMR